MENHHKIALAFQLFLLGVRISMRDQKLKRLELRYERTDPRFLPVYNRQKDDYVKWDKLQKKLKGE